MIRSARLLFTLASLSLGAGCAHTSGSLSELAAPFTSCEEDDVSVLDIQPEGDGHRFRAYCHGESFACVERDDAASCEREARILATDAERARVSTTDRAVRVSGQGESLLLQLGIDAGRSRLLLFAYPRASGERVSMVLDSRLREASRESCAFSLVADADAELLEKTGYERTDYGERASLAGTMRGIRRAGAASRTVLRVCDEELPIDATNREALATFASRYDAEAAAPAGAAPAAPPASAGTP